MKRQAANRPLRNVQAVVLPICPILLPVNEIMAADLSPTNLEDALFEVASR
jgi:hypothetical protein